MIPKALIWLSLFLCSPSLTYAKVKVPPSSSIVTVKAFNSINPGPQNTLPANIFVFPSVPGKENLDLDVLAFLIENPTKKKKVMFDIGVRKDVENFAPANAALFKAGANFDIIDIPSQLKSGGIPLANISAVIWSHSHLDHIGDMSLFPNSTSLVIGSETNTSTYPTNPNGLLLESDFAGHELVKISFNETSPQIGGFRSFDYFGDGSLYLLDVPGHALGHMAALARVTASPASFILLTGDTFHQAGQIRPSFHLHEHIPVPQDILSSSRHTMDRKYFFAPDDTTDLHNHTTPLLSVATGAESVYADPVTARISQYALGEFDNDPDFLLLSAHDPSAHDLIDYFPKDLNGWKKKGIKDRAVWSFADVKARGYRLS